MKKDIEEDYVSFEVARLAKKAGFNWIVRRWYEDFGNKDLFEPITPANYNDEKVFSDVISAPTQSLLQKWFRKIHNIHIEVICNNIITKIYTSEITTIGFEKITEIFTSYEEVLEKGLQEAFKILKNDRTINNI